MITFKTSDSSGAVALSHHTLIHMCTRSVHFPSFAVKATIQARIQA